MSKQVDNRIVSLELDNGEFESNARQSIKTLDDLEKGLQFEHGTDGLEKVQNAGRKFNLEGMTIAIQSVISQFSALEIAGITAVQNLTNKAVDAAERMVKSLTIDQVTAGWGKYEEKTASVQTLMNSTGKSIEEIDTYLEKLMWFSDETSYSFNDMTAALAQMTSSGGDIDKLMPMITGIANATAFAGKGANEFKSTIRNLAQSYQAGHLQLMDMKSLNLMGTSSKQLKESFIQAAEAMGKIEKGTVTLENFDTTLAKGWADTEVMETALGRFSQLSEAAYEAVEAGEFDTAAEAIEALAGDYDELAVRAFKSAQEAKSFSEAIDATKDAVSSGWLETFELIFGNYEESKVMWTELANEMWDVFASGAEARNDALKKWREAGGRDDFIQSIKNIYTGLKSIVKPIKDAWDAIFPDERAEILINLTGKLKTFSEKFRAAFEVIEEKVEEVTEPLEEAKEGIENIIGPIQKTKEVLDELANSVIYGKYGNGEARRKALEEEGYSYELVQNKVNELLGSSYRYEIAEEDATEASMSRKEAMREELLGMQEFQKTERKTAAGTEERVNRIRRIFAGLFSALDIVKMALTALGKAAAFIFKTSWEIFFGPLIDIFLDVAAGIGDAISGFRDLAEKTDWFNQKLAPIAGSINKWVIKISNAFWIFLSKLEQSPVIEALKKKLEALWPVLKEIGGVIFDTLISTFTTLFETIKQYLPSGDQLLSWVEKAASYLGEFIDFIVSHKQNVIDFFGAFTEDAAGGIETVAGALSGFVTVIGEFFRGKFDTLSGYLGQITGFFEHVATDTEGPIASIKEKFGDIVDFINKAWEELSIEKIFKALKQVGGGMILYKIFETFNHISKSVENITSIPKAISGVLGEVKNTLVAYQDSLRAGTILKIAEAIGILALAIFGLSFIEPEQLDKATAAIVMVMLALTALIAVITKFKQIKVDKTGAESFIEPLSNFLTGVKDAIAKGFKLAGYGMLILGIGAALAILMSVIGNIMQWDWAAVGGKFWKAVGVVAVLGLLITALMTVYSMLGKKKIKIGDALSFITLAVSIGMLVGVLQTVMDMMSELKGGTGPMWEAVAMISILGIVIGVAMALSAQNEHLIAFGVGAVLMAMGIMKIAKAINLLSKINPGRMLVAALVLSAVIAGLSFLAYTFAGMKDIEKGTKAIRSMALSLMIFAAALTFAGIFAPAIQAALGPLLIVMAALLGIAAVVGALNGAQSLAAVGEAFKNMGIGMLALSAAIFVLALAIPHVVAALIYLGQAVKEHGPELAEGLKVMVVIAIAAMLGALIASKAQIFGTLAQMIQGAFNVIMTLAKSNLPAMLGMVGVIVVAVLAFLNTILPQVTEMVFNLIITFMHSIAHVLREQAPALFEAIVDILDAIWDMLVEFVALIVEKIPLGKGLADWLRGAKDFISDDAEALGDSIMGKFEAKYGETNEKIKAETRETENAYHDLVWSAEESNNEFDDNMANHASNVEDSTSRITGSYADMKSALLKGEDVTGSMDGMMDQILGNIQVPEEFSGAMDGNMDALLGSFTAGSEETVSASEEMVENTEKPIINMSSRMPTHGQNLVAGLTEGINGRADEAVAAVGNLVTRMNEEWAKLQDEHSPSRVWFDFGKFLMIGLSNGIKKFTDVVVASTNSTGNSMNFAMAGAMSQMQETMNSNLDFAPTIRPVFDSSGIKSGAGMINDIFASNQNASLYVGNIMTKDMRVAQQINDTMDARIGELKGLMKMQYEKELDLRVEVPVNIDGRETARVIAPYARSELTRLDRNENRRNGRV